MHMKVAEYCEEIVPTLGDATVGFGRELFIQYEPLAWRFFLNLDKLNN